jgi:hypothetical protein
VEVTKAVEYHIIMAASIERKRKESMEDGVPFIWKKCFEIDSQVAFWDDRTANSPGIAEKAHGSWCGLNAAGSPHRT